MSVDLLLFPTEGRFSGEDIKSAFGDFGTETADGLHLQYDRENDAFVYFELDETGTTDSFCVNRPCGDARLYEALFGFMRAQRAYLVCADCDPPVRVTDDEALRACALMMPGSEENIVVVESPDELLG